MKYFFDTSALIKNYIDESGSKKIRELLISTEVIYISEITQVECVTVLKHLWKNKFLSERDFDLIRSVILEDLNSFHIITISGEIINSILQLPKEYYFKSLDSFSSCLFTILQNKRRRWFLVINILIKWLKA